MPKSSNHMPKPCTGAGAVAFLAIRDIGGLPGWQPERLNVVSIRNSNTSSLCLTQIARGAILLAFVFLTPWLA
jgi:hypothetical protein